MRKVITVIFIIYSGLCFSQTRDTTLTETEPLTKDKASEISISMISPGISIYTSEINDYLTNNSYFNMLHVGISFKNISANFLLNIKGLNLRESFTFQNQFWDKGMELTHYSLGFNLGYKFHLSSKFVINPYAGISSSNYYLVKHNMTDPEQRSNTSFCGQYGVNAEYRFKSKRNYLYVIENGDIEWGNSYWSILLQTGIFPSIFRGNTGLKGNLLYITIGASFNIGSYIQYRK